MSKKITVKEQLVDIIRANGYDFITACEMATQAINEFLESGKSIDKYYIGNQSFTLVKKVK
jgi:hypothetical protein